MFEAAYRAGYDLVVITLTRLPCVVAIMAAVVLSYLAYRLRVGPPKRGAWPAIFALLALYGFLAALAGYASLDPARKAASAGAAGRSGGPGWSG